MSIVNSFPGGEAISPAVLEPLSVTANGAYAPEQGVDGFDEVTVAVPDYLEKAKHVTNLFNGATFYEAKYSNITFNLLSALDGELFFNPSYGAVATGATITINVPSMTSMKNFPKSPPGIDYELIVNASDAVTNMNGSFNGSAAYAPRKITIGFSTENVQDFNSCFLFAGSGVVGTLEEIGGQPLDLSAALNTTNMFKLCQSLETIAFKRSTIKINLDISASHSLSNASLVSIANGLSEAVSAKTLTLYSTMKSNLYTILGTVTDGLFVEDESGATNLLDFITLTKGWTVA